MGKVVLLLGEFNPPSAGFPQKDMLPVPRCSDARPAGWVKWCMASTSTMPKDNEGQQKVQL